MVVLLLGLVGLVGWNHEPRKGGDANPARVAEMQQILRDLWVGLIIWVRHVVSNIATNDPEEGDAALAHLASNADNIGDFLLNPYLQKDIVRGLIATHGTHHVLEINQYKAKGYAHVGATWPMMREHVHAIADTDDHGVGKAVSLKILMTGD